MESSGGGGSGVRGVKRERPRKFHDRRISTAVTLSFKDTKEMQDCCAQQQKQVKNVFFPDTLDILCVEISNRNTIH